MPDPSSLQYWADLMNSRQGHASEFATANTPGITEIVERAVAQEFADALVQTEYVALTNVANNPNDPPDCFAKVDNTTVGIELVELVDAKALAKAKKGCSSQAISGQFLETQWDQDRFTKEVNALIDRKNAKYEAKKQTFDCLLMYTGEPWMLPNDVQTWLANAVFSPRYSFKCVYLLMSYDPGYSQKHWPLFNIYGSLM